MNGPNLVHLFFLFVAMVCFFLAFIRYREGGPVSIGWLGLCLWMLDLLIFSGVKS
jgi:hypothetical protein